MEYDLIYPETKREMYKVPRVVAAVYFDEDELIDLGVPEDSYEVQDPFWDLNEFEKPFKLWESEKYLIDFYDQNRTFLEQEYWKDVTEYDFLDDVIKSLNTVKKKLIDKMESNDFHSLVEPLDDGEEEKRIFDSIKIKVKQGQIKGRHPFRFYAIEIEERKCYLITGAAIKIHKDMGKAPNTKIELDKLEKVYNVLEWNGIKTKDTFIEFFKKEQINAKKQ